MNCFLKRVHHHKCILVDFAKFSRATIFIEHLRAAISMHRYQRLMLDSDTYCYAE